MYLVAHRGLQSKNTKENTLGAIMLGDKNPNIDAVELDVRLTKDNRVVVIHDDTIDRVTNGKGKVNEMSLSRLKMFNCGSFFKRVAISTLEEILDKFSINTLLIIELKDEGNNNIFLARKVLEITSRYPNLNICFKSFNKDIVLYLKEQTKRPVGVLINENNINYLDLDMDFYSISKKVINYNMVNNILSKNKKIMVWTVNSSEEMDYLKNSLGKYLDEVYVISDNPLIYLK